MFSHIDIKYISPVCSFLLRSTVELFVLFFSLHSSVTFFEAFLRTQGGRFLCILNVASYKVLKAFEIGFSTT